MKGHFSNIFWLGNKTNTPHIFPSKIITKFLLTSRSSHHKPQPRMTIRYFSSSWLIFFFLYPASFGFQCLCFKQPSSSCRILSGRAVVFAYKADLIKSFPHSVCPPCCWTSCRGGGGRSWFC